MSEKLPVLLVQMGRPPVDIRNAVGDQPSWFEAALKHPEVELKIVRPFLDEPLPAPETFQAAVITGSWSMVTEHEAWSERTAEWIKQVVAAGTPLFGVCYGHQLMAYALGGRVDYHPQGSEVGQLQVELNAAGQKDPALAHLPPAFPVFLSHEQSVLELPPGAVCLGASSHDANQIIRYTPSAISVQFHPEFTPSVMNKIIASRSERAALKGKDKQALLSEVSGTPEARAILQRFVLPSA
ncbi:glutamine amidotransferase [Cedecea davisae]|uniref:glutamine amidotransferase n=1 Tax=Cedecea davisae TaxID=158484 RepID=UPI00376F3E05